MSWETGNMGPKRKRWGYLFAAPLCAAVIYAWDLWYYGGLYRADRLLSAAEAGSQNFGALFLQHIIVILPELVMLGVAVLLFKGKAIEIFGFRMEKRKGRIAVLFVGIGYVFLLIAGLIWGDNTAFSILYQWGYYLFFVAFAEELVFRGLLPWFVQESGLPQWCVWIIPGVLFGLMHTLMPLIQQGFTVEIAKLLASSLLGYLAGACLYMALRRWSGTLWLSVLLHAALDFTVIFR